VAFDRENILHAAERGKLSVRDMVGSDLTSVLTIEANAQVSPWARLSFEESLTKQCCCRVIEALSGVNNEEAEIVAYHIVCPIVDELHILNVVTASQFQGLGLGHMLMADILEIAESKNLAKLFLEVRASNSIAQSLYLKWQFKQVALRKQYYRPTSDGGGREDAFVYMRTL